MPTMVCCDDHSSAARSHLKEPGLGPSQTGLRTVISTAGVRLGLTARQPLSAYRRLRSDKSRTTYAMSCDSNMGAPPRSPRCSMAPAPPGSTSTLLLVHVTNMKPGHQLETANILAINFAAQGRLRGLGASADTHDARKIQSPDLLNALLPKSSRHSAAPCKDLACRLALRC